MENNRNNGACNMETEEQNNKPRRRKRIKVYKKRGEQSLRTEHCSRLSRLLSALIQQRNWKEASGVLSALLKGTAREQFPKENRSKYLAAMELLKKTENHYIKITNMKRVYEVWIRKNGAMKKFPAKDKFSTSLEFVLFCLTHGDIDGANQATTSLTETEYGNDPVLNMIVGMLFYELWYTCIPEEMKLKSSDIFVTPMLSELSGLDSYNPVESTCCNSFDHQGMESSAQSDSASSIGNNKNQPVESVSSMPREPSNQVFQPQGFYMENSSEISGKEDANHGENLMDISIFKFRGLNASLLPIKLPKLNENFGNSVKKYMEMLNDNYSKAVKHLRFALHSNPPVLASLLPLVQLLLLGDQVEEAAKEVENICQTSNTLLPLRIKAILLECFDCKNSIMLSACYEDILNKDPTCSECLTRLITMHKNGDYGLVQLLEMIALHLDATYATCKVWEEFAACFLKLFHSEEDQLSVCGSTNEGVGQRSPTTTNTNPVRFIQGNARKTWELRCRWWSKRYFGKNAHLLDVEAGERELSTFKAACASHLYGPECQYVASVYACLEKAEKRDQIVFLQRHMRHPVKVSEQLKSKEIILDDHSCFSN